MIFWVLVEILLVFGVKGSLSLVMLIGVFVIG